MKINIADLPTLTNFKIRKVNKEEFKTVQIALFTVGINWGITSVNEPLNLVGEEASMYVTDSKLTWSECTPSWFFNAKQLPEVEIIYE